MRIPLPRNSREPARADSVPKGMSTTALFVWLGGTLAGLGTLLAAWALLWDRAHGRKRCPKCWYDMAGVEALPAACPECGRVVRRERGLRRTRQRWVVASLSVAVAAGSLFAMRVPSMIATSNPKSLPSEILVRWAPPPSLWSYYRKYGDDEYTQEVLRRGYDGRLSDRQIRILLTRFSEAEPNFKIKARRNAEATHDEPTEIALLVPWWTLGATRCDTIRVIGPGGAEAVPDRSGRRRLYCGNSPVYPVAGLIHLPESDNALVARIEYIRHDPPIAPSPPTGALFSMKRPGQSAGHGKPPRAIVVWSHELPIEVVHR